MTELAGAESRDPAVRNVSRSLQRKIVLVCGAAAALYAGLLFYADADAVEATLRNVPLGPVVISLGLATLSFALRFVRWSYLLRELGLCVPVAPNLLIYGAGLAMSITPGKSGELLKALMLEQAIGASAARTSGVVIAERLSDLVGLLLLGALGLWGHQGAWLAIMLALTAAISLGIVFRWQSTLLALLERRMPRLASFVQRLRPLFGSLEQLFKARTLLFSLSLSLLAWSVHALAFVVVVTAFPAVSLSFGEALVANSAPLLAGALSMLPGGLGLTEASMTGVIMAFGGSGATMATAAAITLVVRLVTLWWAILLGLGCLVAWNVRQR